MDVNKLNVVYENQTKLIELKILKMLSEFINVKNIDTKNYKESLINELENNGLEFKQEYKDDCHSFELYKDDVLKSRLRVINKMEFKIPNQDVMSNDEICYKIKTEISEIEYF